jgi:tetratricopeptide (TPR) repeat protein
MWPALAFALVATACRGAGSDSQPRATADTGPAPTFTKDVAPIVFKHCVTCHRPGQVAPFSLLEYSTAKAHADDIAKAVGERKMPPWMPDPGELHFLNERRLSERDIDVIRAWVRGGAPEGNAADLPPAPRFAGGWELGTPDLVVTMPKPFTVQPGPRDRYRHVVLPLSLPAGKYVRAVEFRPGPAPVHHAVIRVDRTHASRRRDGADGQPGFDAIMAPDVQNPDGHFLGWTPGQGPIVAPQGMPWRLDKGADLVIELHLQPGKTPAATQPSVGLYFADQPPAETPVALTMGTKTIAIPAGERNYRVSDSYVFPVDVTLLSLYPHAHYLGTDMQILALLPDGTTKSLLHIKDWEFHWQQDYRFVTPVALPKGTTITMRYTYDNSAENPENPQTPPRLVTYGPQATDEMANLALQVVPRSRADGVLLTKAFLERDALANVASAEMLVKLDATSPEHLRNLGAAYVEVGRFADAVPPLEAALRLDSRSASAETHLGRALIGLRRVDEGLAHLHRAVTLAPDDERMHVNLGKVLSETGQLAAGLQAFQRAIAINPDYAEAYESLGIGLYLARKLQESIAAFRRAVELAPTSASAENGLGGALAQAGNPGEALQHIQRALAIDPGYVPAQNNLARLQRGK